MGTIMDLTKGSSHDHVDNPFWSVFQIKVKHLPGSVQGENQKLVGDDDLGKVIELRLYESEFIIGAPFRELDL